MNPDPESKTPARNLWPIAIVIVLVGFFCGTIGLVVMACSQRVDLVSADYYERELKFQGQIERIGRTSQLASPGSVIYDAVKKRITIALPSEQGGTNIAGEVALYRPSAAGLDRRFDLQPDAQGLQRLDAADLRPGLWRVRVSWTAGRQDYYLEQSVVIGSRKP